jgi:hypothetical protein
MTYLQCGGFKYKCDIQYHEDRIYIQTPFSKPLIAAIKQMRGAKWHGYDKENPRKIWSVHNCLRNIFQLTFLEGLNPYKPYDAPLVDYTPKRKLYDHQTLLIRHALTRHYGIWAAEMGTGKTLAAIELMEYVWGTYPDHELYWYVGPVSGVKAVSLELLKWGSQVRPRMFTYERLVREIKDWHPTNKVPRVLILDESSKIKTPESQRSQAAMAVAHEIRKTYGREGYVVLLSGTPAPKTPCDWYNQTEVACPGWFVEGDIHKFKKRLCVIEERESFTGGVYPHIVTWKDDPNKCDVCGQLAHHENHATSDPTYQALVGEPGKSHAFKPSANEVAKVYDRMAGLTIVMFKKDCLDLPEKTYEIIRVKPTVEMLRAAKIIANTAPRAIQALTMMRELSDGFQYAEEALSTDVCPKCGGNGKIVAPVPDQPVDTMAPMVEPGPVHDEVIECPQCRGSGVLDVISRTTRFVGSPKDDVLSDIADQHEEIGRLIVWGGFMGTVDRIAEYMRKLGWHVLAIDGRGYRGYTPDGDQVDGNELLIAMDQSHPRFKELREKYDLLCVVGNPMAGGMALTLTASPTMVYYSNVFNGESRMQADDRNHRPGQTRNCRIVDLFCLPCDQLVYDNLKRKRKLQDLTMGEVREAMTHDSVA